jgi:hypothetical protein
LNTWRRWLAFLSSCSSKSCNLRIFSFHWWFWLNWLCWLMLDFPGCFSGPIWANWQPCAGWQLDGVCWLRCRIWQPRCCWLLCWGEHASSKVDDHINWLFMFLGLILFSLRSLLIFVVFCFAFYHQCVWRVYALPGTCYCVRWARGDLWLRWHRCRQQLPRRSLLNIDVCCLRCHWCDISFIGYPYLICVVSVCLHLLKPCTYLSHFILLAVSPFLFQVTVLECESTFFQFKFQCNWKKRKIPFRCWL